MNKLKRTLIWRKPNDWEIVRLAELFSLEYGKSLIEKERKKGDYPVFGSNGVVGSHTKYLVKGPGIVIGRKGTIGAVTWSDKNFWPIDTTYFIVLKKSNADFRWLFYKLALLNLSKLNMATGTPGLNRNLVYNLKFFLPPLPEQKKIAEILMTVDEAIEKVDGAIQKAERLKKGLMQKLLSRSKKLWECVTIKEISRDLLGGGTPSTSQTSYWNGKIAWMTSAHISDREITFGQKHITEEGLKKSATKLIPKNNLLVATRVGIGKLAINKIDIAISQDLTGILVKSEKILSDYLYWFLLTEKNLLKALAQGSTIKGILKDDLAKLKLPLPPLPEQKKIAEILSAADHKLELMRERKSKLERVKKGLMNDLLTGRKRVRLDA